MKVFNIAVVFAIFSVSMVWAQNPNVVLYMPFDEPPDGDLVKDLSIYENHGKIIGDVKWRKNGRFGGALEFSGTGKIEVPHSESLNLKGDMTLQIWFKTKEPQKGRFLIYKIHIGAGRNYEWGIYLTGGSQTVSMYLVDPQNQVKFVSKSGNWGDGEWHFLVGTYDGKAVRCYIDGELGGEVAWSGEVRTSEGSVVIGTWGGNYFIGMLDEARILNMALTPEQIKKDYENGYQFSPVVSSGKLATKWGEIKKSELSPHQIHASR